MKFRLRPRRCRSTWFVVPTMMSKQAKQTLVKTISEHISKKFGGSGDLETEDAFDAVDYFEKQYGDKLQPLKVTLIALMARLEVLDPTWRSGRQNWIEHVPPPNENGSVEFFAAPWQLGLRATDSIKGKSSMVSVLECCVSFLERPYDSVGEPLNVLMHRGATVDSPVPDFGLRHSIGFSKSLAARILLESIVELNLSDSDIALLKKEIQALYMMKCVYNPASNVKEQVFMTISTKMAAAERQRPTVAQICSAMKMRAMEEGVEYTTAIGTYVDEFNSESALESRQLSAQETAVIKVCKPIFPGRSIRFSCRGEGVVWILVGELKP